MRRTLFESEHESYRDSVRTFIEREITPSYGQWEADGIIARSAWEAAGRTGLLGLSAPIEYDGAGEPDYRFRMVVSEEIARAGVTSFGSGISVHDDIVLPYLIDLGTPDQLARWVPGLVAGTSIGAIAMTEPSAGSDLRGIRTTARRDGDLWILDGQKTFITNAIHADVVVVFARTDSGDGGSGFSLFVVERGMPGFERGRKLAKIGLASQDTAELFFDGVRLGDDALLGEAGRGLSYLMERLPRERLSIAVNAISAARAAFDLAVTHSFGRQAFGQAIADFQHTRFTLADMATEIDVAGAYVDAAVLALNAGELSAVDAAKAKWWTTELQKSVVDRALQLHGGYGYMTEYPIALAYLDSRVQTIYGGTTEIMKEIIGRDIARGARTSS